jgi:hypothetical protein
MLALFSLFTLVFVNQPIHRFVQVALPRRHNALQILAMTLCQLQNGIPLMRC